MKISKDYIAVEKFEEPKTEGFQTVQVQDNSTFKGVVKYLPEQDMGTSLQEPRLKVGDVVLFAKYSPDTHDIEEAGEKLKFVKLTDILAIL